MNAGSFLLPSPTCVLPLGLFTHLSHPQLPLAGTPSHCVSSYLPGSSPEGQPVSIFWGICKRLSCQKDPFFLAPEPPILIKPHKQSWPLHLLLLGKGDN